jgi:hypothetical protein
MIMSVGLVTFHESLEVLLSMAVEEFCLPIYLRIESNQATWYLPKSSKEEIQKRLAETGLQLEPMLQESSK